MNIDQRERAMDLLQIASSRLKDISGDISSFNLLSALQIEHLETQTHSKIIFYLLADNSNSQDTKNSFLKLFLQTLNIPRQFLCETWNVYRERIFDGGASRIDFVIESKSYCIIIEMKIDAGDGSNQLTRYETFAREKGKEYRIFYLTIDGHMPTEQSASGIDKNKLHCISFKKEIISWLQLCMKHVEKSGFKFSFLKQYLGAVKDIAGVNDGVLGVKDLINNSDMARAAQLVSDSFHEKMDDVSIQFFRELDSIIRRKTKLETELFDDALNVWLKEFTFRKRPYRVKIFVDYDPYLEVGIAFSEIEEDGYITLKLDEAEKRFPSVYRQWIEKTESLEGVPKFKRWSHSKYFILENSRGSQLNFRDYSAQVELIDEMKQQCKYISDYIISLVINPLLED